MSKKLCKTTDDKKKDVLKKKNKYPKFECKRCGGEAAKEKHLCKPKKIK